MECVRFLKNHGAAIVHDHSGQSPVDLAARGQHWGIYELLAPARAAARLKKIDADRAAAGLHADQARAGQDAQRELDALVANTRKLVGEAVARAKVLARAAGADPAAAAEKMRSAVTAAAAT